jgi:hypothetical protein
VAKYVSPGFRYSRVEEGKPERQLSLLKGPRQRGIVPRAQALEYELHCAVADTLRVSLSKGWYWTTIDHGEERPIMAASRLQRKGVKPGLPDILLIGPDGRHYWLELKTRKGRLSDEQEAFRDAMEERQVLWAMAVGYDEAIAWLKRWGAVRIAL